MTVSTPMAETAQYEVILVPSEISVTSSDWTWRRLERDGSISAWGMRHDTMKACFAEVRWHKEAFGDAAITVNLLGEGARAAPSSAAMAERAISIPSVTLKRRLRRQVALRH